MNNKSACEYLQSHKLAVSMLSTAELNNEDCILP